MKRSFYAFLVCGIAACASAPAHRASISREATIRYDGGISRLPVALRLWEQAGVVHGEALIEGGRPRPVHRPRSELRATLDLLDSLGWAGPEALPPPTLPIGGRAMRTLCGDGPSGWLQVRRADLTIERRDECGRNDPASGRFWQRVGSVFVSLTQGSWSP